MNNNNRKNNRVLIPINENNYSPDVPNKCKMFLMPVVPKNYYDMTTTESYSNQPLPTAFTQSPDYLVRKNKADEFPNNISMTQLNTQLDKNLNELIILLNRRKNLVNIKKRKVIEMAQEQLNKVKQNGGVHDADYLNDQDFIKITSFAENPRTAIKMLGKVVHTVSLMKEPRSDEQDRSKAFWARNYKLQHDIDMMLQKLKQIDKQLQKQNGEIFQVCKELDRIEETLKSFVGIKSPDHVQKVEPLFNSKKKNYDILNKKLKDREACKDKKIQYTKRIMGTLQDLTKTRQGRLGQIADFFGIQDCWEFDQLNFKQQQDFGSGLQELFKMKQRDNQLQVSQKEVFLELDAMQKQQQKIYNDLLKIISDQAKSFYNFNGIQNERKRYNSILKIFQADIQNFSIDTIDPKQFLRKFKEVKYLFKKFLQEDSLVKVGLVKTATTEKTFINMLKATESQRERRCELLTLLETCIRKRQQYEQKRDQMRDIQFQESKNDQSLIRYEQDLQTVLTDGDLEGYKKIGGAIGKCESQKIRLCQVRELLDKQMQAMDRQVLGIANRIKEEYQDILADVLPSNYQYSLKSGEDVKKLRNQLRKMYKRLGLLSNQ